MFKLCLTSKNNLIKNIPYKISFFKINFYNFSSKGEDFSDDEVALINQLITNPHTSKTKSSPMKPDLKLDMKRFFDNKKKPQDEDTFIRNKLKKLSEADQATIRRDEDVTKYRIQIKSEQESDKILDSIFKKGTNAKFVEKLDLIYERVQNEEMEDWGRLGTSKNIDDVILEDKDLSDIEDEINKMMNSKIEEEKKVNKMRTIEDYMIIERKNEKSEKVVQIPQKSEKSEKVVEIPQKSEKVVEIPQKSEKVIQNPKKVVEIPQKSEKSEKSEIPKKVEKVKIPQKTEPKSKKSSSLKKTPLPKPKPSLDYFNSFSVPNTKETHIQSTFLNLNYDNLYNLFDHISINNLYDKKEIVLKSSNKVISKKVFKKNIQKVLVDNYQIKILLEKFSIRLFKNVLFDVDRRRFENITSRILNSEAETINIVYNAKRSAVTKEGYGVFMIFAEEDFVGTILVNLGQIQNVNISNYFVSFISLIFVELIQICSQKSNRLLNFNLVVAKKFDLESKLTCITKTPLINILNNLIEGKLSKFKKESNVDNFIMNNSQQTDLDEVFDEIGNKKSIKNLKKAKSLSTIPNLKFYIYSTLFKKYFNKYFLSAAKLDEGNLCFKI